jgi:hypothetical protein
VPYSLPLPPHLSGQGWKAKIRDKERLEPPHVSVIHKTRTWRIDLRRGRFLDHEPPPKAVPAALRRHISDNLPLLRDVWDRMYPENPVGDAP